MGGPIFDNLDLELVEREAARRQRWEFLVRALPAAVPGATGSVFNPIATFLNRMANKMMALKDGII